MVFVYYTRDPASTSPTQPTTSSLHIICFFLLLKKTNNELVSNRLSVMIFFYFYWNHVLIYSDSVVVFAKFGISELFIPSKLYLKSSTVSSLRFCCACVHNSHKQFQLNIENQFDSLIDLKINFRNMLIKVATNDYFHYWLSTGSFPELKLMSPNSLFCQSNRPNPKDVQRNVDVNREKHGILLF